MERGDFLKEKITRLCREEKINEAVVSSGIATFDIVNIQMSNNCLVNHSSEKQIKIMYF